MASILRTTVIFSLTMLVAACSTSQQSKRESLGDENYLNTAKLQEIKGSSGITLPLPYSDYSIPTNEMPGALGKAVDIRPPDQLIPSIRGIRVQSEGNSGIIVFDFSLKQELPLLIEQTLAANKQNISSRPDTNTFITDWIEWKRGDEDIPYKARYEISIKDTGYQRAISVKLGDIRHQTDETVMDNIQIHRYTVAMLNSLISGMETIMTQQFKEQQASSQDALQVTTATDETGLPLLIVRGSYRQVWQRLPEALAKIGMTVSESNQSHGTMKLKYRALNTESLNAMNATNPGLDKSDYSLQVGDLDNRTSLQFRSKTGQPLGEKENIALQTLMQAAFNQNMVKGE